jgi:hypothetical protein
VISQPGKFCCRWGYAPVNSRSGLKVAAVSQHAQFPPHMHIRVSSLAASSLVSSLLSSFNYPHYVSTSNHTTASPGGNWGCQWVRLSYGRKAGGDAGKERRVVARPLPGP